VLLFLSTIGSDNVSQYLGYIDIVRAKYWYGWSIEYSSLFLIARLYQYLIYSNMRWCRGSIDDRVSHITRI
jgi:hypothetical protein